MPRSKDDDSQNELVTQTSNKSNKDAAPSKVGDNRFKAKVTGNIKAGSKADTRPVTTTDTDTGETKNSVSRLASVKSASRGVLGAIVSNL